MHPGSWLIPLSLALAGCDVHFKATGRVIEQEGIPKSCRLFVREVAGGLSCCSQTVDPRDIHEEFWVMPGKTPYMVVLECPGFQSYTATGIFGQDMSSSQPFDLGEIVLLAK